jgi:hypothetical protein
MRVRQRPSVQVSHTVGELDAVDLEAIRLVRDWGWESDHEERGWTFSPCPRPDCGGAIVSGFSDACILCARNGNAARLLRDDHYGTTTGHGTRQGRSRPSAWVRGIPVWLAALRI